MDASVCVRLAEPPLVVTTAGAAYNFADGLPVGILLIMVVYGVVRIRTARATPQRTAIEIGGVAAPTWLTGERITQPSRS